MKAVLLQLLCVASFVIVDGGHIQKVVGVKDANGQCICSMELSHVVFPVHKVEKMETDFYNLTDFLQNQMNKIYNHQTLITTTLTNLTDLEKRVKYAKTFGTHVDLDFKRLINDIQTVVSMAKNISKNATTDTSKEMVTELIKEIDTINTVVTTMEKYDRNNIITAQREIIALRKKLQDCEEEIALASGIVPAMGSPSIGKCDHDGILKVSDPVLVKLNWKGSDFRAGSWGKDFAIGTKFPDHYWVFPMNDDGRTLENYRLYSSYKKLLLYSPIREYSLNVNTKKKCENCGQGAGVVFFNGSFFYNCFDSRALCKADPFNLRISRMNLEDEDPASFNNWFSYKGVKYQDMDLAGDEKGLWMIHGSTVANGNVVIRKVDPGTLSVGSSPWITTQAKDQMSNSFMICGVLYATKRKNSTHEEIYYMYDTNTGRESNTQIFMEKPLPIVQSLNYNPNDQKLYMYNDGYLVYYNLTLITRKVSKAEQVTSIEQQQDSDTKEQQSMVNKGELDTASMEQPSSASNQQQHLASQGESPANQEENPMTVTLVRRNKEGGQTAAGE
ncbi:olfactomedin-like [Rhineura floridana]|uniref:olfactomedin-like n=1 Tax=Rhineura floridana TaxID=261503 RepID=UPI002AC80314|nr:olfactomedin-like [Rhineura floridana]XP_061465309.1 olfactomedin-like [Rhineura floridana]